MNTSETVKKDIWINASKISGDDITIDVNYLNELIDKLQHNQFGLGYAKGYEHGLEVGRGELSCDCVIN